MAWALIAVGALLAVAFGVLALVVLADGTALARFADYRGQATFSGFERPAAGLPREGAAARPRRRGVAAA